MISQGLAPIILHNSHLLHQLLLSSDKFVSAWKTSNPTPAIQGFDGFYEKLPIYRLPELSEGQVALVDLKAFGVMRQYRVSQNDINNDQPLLISINKLADSEVEKIYRQKPKWLKVIGNGKMPPFNIAERKIKQKVGLKISQRFRFEQKNNKAGVLLIPKNK